MRRKFSRNPRRRHRVHHRRFRRNPISTTGFISNTLMPAAIGAAGAIAVDWLGNNLPLPAMFQTAQMAPITKVGLALLAGLGVDMMGGGPRIGGQVAAGGIVVALYNWANANLLSGLPFGAMNPQGYQPYGMARYVRGLAGPNALNVNFQQPIGLRQMVPARPRFRALGAGPHNVTKFRILRGQRGGGTLGYIGPARTMGRYVTR